MTIKVWNTLAAILLVLICCPLRAQMPEQMGGVDSDRDGLSDVLEQALLLQFAPEFYVGEKDCSEVPAEFWRGTVVPEVKAENGTTYGQVFPAAGSMASTPVVEVHYYHLWKKDCGPHGHPLDTEHVSVLVKGSGDSRTGVKWRAVYWYAAAHENTVCDVSQIARASTLHAEDHGARVWISPGKHASYLDGMLCHRGCGADRCEQMKRLDVAEILNLGEPQYPANGSSFIDSPNWPLLAKMQASDFPAEPLDRLNRLPQTDIAWFHAGRHPAQQVIAVSSSTAESLAGGGEATGATLARSKRSTSTAISVAGDSTGGALGEGYQQTKHALGSSVQHVARALKLTSKPSKPR